MRQRDRELDERRRKRMFRLSLIVFGIVLLIATCYGCYAAQERVNVANQGRREVKIIEEWGLSAVEILKNTATAMDSLDAELSDLLILEDAKAIRAKVQTVEEKLNAIGEALFSIDISVPIIRARRAISCLDALIDFTGKQPEHADDETLALFLFRLNEAKLRLQKFQLAIAKITSKITSAIPGASWFDHILKIVLGISTTGLGIGGLRELLKRKKADQHNHYLVKAANNLKGNEGDVAYRAFKKEVANVVPSKDEASYRAMVGRHLAKLK